MQTSALKDRRSDYGGVTGIDRRQSVTHVQPPDRARRAAQVVLTVRGEGDGGPVVPVFDPTGHDADDARVPVLLEQT